MRNSARQFSLDAAAPRCRSGPVSFRPLLSPTTVFWRAAPLCAACPRLRTPGRVRHAPGAFARVRIGCPRGAAVSVQCRRPRRQDKETMPQHAAQQRPLGAADANPGSPGVRSIRHEAAALRAAQAAGTQSMMGSAAQLDVLFARRQVRARARCGARRHAELTRRRAAGHADAQAQRLREAEQRWGLTVVDGDLVAVPGHDWEWQVEAPGNGAWPARRRRSRGACAASLLRLAGRVRDKQTTDSACGAASQERTPQVRAKAKLQRRQRPPCTRSTAPRCVSGAAGRAVTLPTHANAELDSPAAAPGRRDERRAGSATGAGEACGEAARSAPAGAASPQGCAVVRRPDTGTAAAGGGGAGRSVAQSLLACTLAPHAARAGPAAPCWGAGAAIGGFHTHRALPRIFGAHACTL